MNDVFNYQSDIIITITQLCASKFDFLFFLSIIPRARKCLCVTSAIRHRLGGELSYNDKRRLPQGELQSYIVHVEFLFLTSARRMDIDYNKGAMHYG